MFYNGTCRAEELAGKLMGTFILRSQQATKNLRLLE
jgi:hypothetical protein